MILLGCVFLFLATFFLAVSFASLSRVETDVTRRIKKRLRGPYLASQTIQLERKDRLSDLPLFDKILRHLQWIGTFQIYICQSALPISTGAFFLISILLALISFLFSFVFSLGGPVTFFLSLITAGFPLMVISFRRARRFKQFSAGFPDAISRMASSLRAGYSIQMAFEALIQDTATLIAEEFKFVVRQMELGQNFEEALKKMLERMDTPELRLFISSVILQRESGGNLSELLDNLETTIRSRFDLQRELSAASAQGKLSGMVLSFLPIFVGFFVFLIHPDYTVFFFKDPVGKNLLWLCVLGQILGFWTIRKIICFNM